MKEYPGCVLATHSEEGKMKRHIIKLENDDVIRVDDLTIHNIEIVQDEDCDDKVELYIIDSDGNRIEGGTFDKNSFIDAVMQYYNDNY